MASVGWRFGVYITPKNVKKEKQQQKTIRPMVVV
jgi:hypothetical protein